MSNLWDKRTEYLANVAEFEWMVEQHDFTYVMADDSANYKRGPASVQAIDAFMNSDVLPRELCIGIWNKRAAKFGSEYLIKLEVEQWLI